MQNSRTAPDTPDAEESFELEDFEITTEDDAQVVLGKGSFASVYLARCRKDGQLYALKVVS